MTETKQIRPKPIRYDGIADWYASQVPDAASRSATIQRLLGPGDGLCLDLGCGPGSDLAAIAATGRQPVGVELSSDQLRVALRQAQGTDAAQGTDRQAQGTEGATLRQAQGADAAQGTERKRPWLVQGDAEHLPFSANVFPTVVALWVSTDIDDFARAMREVARVLQPGGTFVFYGVHPCFNGPCVERREDGAQIVHPTYRQAERHLSSPWWGADGIRTKVGGMRHLPLAELFTVIIDAGLRMTQVVEPGDDPIPHALVLKAEKLPP